MWDSLNDGRQQWGGHIFFSSDDNIIRVLHDMPVSMNTELSELGQLRISSS